MISPRLFPDIGGIETHVSEVAPRIAATGTRVTLLTTDRTHLLPSAGNIRGVPYLRFRAYPRSGDYYFAPGLLWHLLRVRYSIFHVQGANNTVPFYAMLAALVTRTPFVISYHSGGPTTDLRARLRGAQFRLLGVLARRAGCLIAVSDFEAGLITETVRSERIDVAVIRNGAVFSAAEPAPPHDGDGAAAPPPWPLVWSPAADAVVVVSIGRLERYKGHHRAIGALPALRRLMPTAELLILGVGPERANLVRQAAELDVADAVHIDHVPPERRESLSAVLRRCDLAVLLSEYEAHPVAVMEAAAVGASALVSMTSGMTEIVRLGWALGAPLDCAPAHLAELMQRAIASGRSVPLDDLPTWDECASKIDTVYRGVLEKSLAGRR